MGPVRRLSVFASDSASAPVPACPRTPLRRFPVALVLVAVVLCAAACTTVGASPPRPLPVPAPLGSTAGAGRAADAPDGPGPVAPAVPLPAHEVLGTAGSFPGVRHTARASRPQGGRAHARRRAAPRRHAVPHRGPHAVPDLPGGLPVPPALRGLPRHGGACGLAPRYAGRTVAGLAARACARAAGAP